MTRMVTINRIEVDADDPCALKSALELVRIRIIAGENVEEFSLQSPVTRETVRFSPANMKALEAEIDRLDRACRRQNGCAVPTRRMRFRY